MGLLQGKGRIGCRKGGEVGEGEGKGREGQWRGIWIIEPGIDVSAG